MITKEDSRYTYDCKDRYVIEPNIHQWDSERLKKNKIKGNKVQENFEYTSNLNKTWLTRKDLLSLEKFF